MCVRRSTSEEKLPCGLKSKHIVLFPTLAFSCEGDRTMPQPSSSLQTESTITWDLGPFFNLVNTYGASGRFHLVLVRVGHKGTEGSTNIFRLFQAYG